MGRASATFLDRFDLLHEAESIPDHPGLDDLAVLDAVDAHAIYADIVARWCNAHQLACVPRRADEAGDHFVAIGHDLARDMINVGQSMTDHVDEVCDIELRPFAGGHRRVVADVMGIDQLFEDADVEFVEGFIEEAERDGFVGFC